MNMSIVQLGDFHRMCSYFRFPKEFRKFRLLFKMTFFTHIKWFEH